MLQHLLAALVIQQMVAMAMGQCNKSADLGSPNRYQELTTDSSIVLRECSQGLVFNPNPSVCDCDYPNKVLSYSTTGNPGSQPASLVTGTPTTTQASFIPLATNVSPLGVMPGQQGNSAPAQGPPSNTQLGVIPPQPGIIYPQPGLNPMLPTWPVRNWFTPELLSLLPWLPAPPPLVLPPAPSSPQLSGVPPVPRLPFAPPGVNPATGFTNLALAHTLDFSDPIRQMYALQALGGGGLNPLSMFLFSNL